MHAAQRLAGSALASLGQERWTPVDDLLGSSSEQTACPPRARASAAAELPPIAVSASQGKLLELLVRVQGARSILELGTLGGYSTIWLARALPAGGRLVTLEASPRYAEVARANIARAGLADRVRCASARRRDAARSPPKAARST